MISSQAPPATFLLFLGLGLFLTFLLLFLELLLVFPGFLLLVWLAVFLNDLAILDDENITVLEDESAILAVNGIEGLGLVVVLLARVLF